MLTFPKISKSHSGHLSRSTHVLTVRLKTWHDIQAGKTWKGRKGGPCGTLELEQRDGELSVSMLESLSDHTRPTTTSRGTRSP